MATKPGTLLTQVPNFPKAAADQLAQLWLTTAEELMSAASQSGGPQSLQTYLNASAADVQAMIELAQAAVPQGVSFFDEEDIELPLGAILDENVPPADAEPSSFADLPEKVDLTPHMPPVRNQGFRGTCVAHSVTAYREYLLGDQSTGANLSEQFLYCEAKQRDGFPGDGTWIRVAMGVLKDVGICREETWPYNPNPNPANIGQGPVPANAETEANGFKVVDITCLNATWVDTLRQAIAGGLPVSFGVKVYTSMQRPNSYRVGDVRLPLPGERSLGGHAMLAVGYEDDPEVPGGGYFIVRNSWGEAFGHDGEVSPGYCRIPYQYFRQEGAEAYVASMAENRML